MIRRAAAAAAVLAAGCHHAHAPAAQPAPPPPAPTAPSDLSPALAPLAWWLGAWQSQDPTAGNDGNETWTAADGALYGVALHSGGHFEVLIVDDADGPGPADGKLRLFAMPDGRAAVAFAAKDPAAGTAIAFANPQHDWPKTIGYARDGAELVAKLGDDPLETIKYKPIDKPARAPELEQADLAFAKATAEQGAAGWVAAFATDGAMGRKDKLIERKDIEAAIAPVLADGKLVWAPMASGVLGDVGFTVGKAHFEPKSGKPADAWKSTYVTIWRRDSTGWKVRFDTGRPVNE